MRKRNIISTLALAAALALGGAQLLMVAEANGAAVAPPAAEAQQKKGGGFGRALSAPFRAIGRLFGGGGKNGKKQAAQRVTEEDAASFEGATMVRVSTTDLAQPAGEAGGGFSSLEKVARARRMLGEERFSEAIALLSSAAAIAPDVAEAHHLLGYAYGRKGLRQLSAESFERAVRLAPNDAQLLNDYGHTLFLRGDYRGAKDRLKRAAKLAPGDERIWNNLALAQARLEDFDDAFKSFSRAGGEFKGRMNVAGLLERSGRAKEALKHYEAARRLDPGSRVVLQHLADLYQRLGRSEEAEAARQAMAALRQDVVKGGRGGR